MKETLLIITLLFSYNANAAPKPSPKGLEGWGDSGVGIYVTDYTKLDKDFPLKSIKNKVKLRLRQSGFGIDVRVGSSDILINAIPINFDGRVTGYSVRIEIQRLMYFNPLNEFSDNVTHYALVTAEDYVLISPKSDLIKLIDQLMDRFLLEYLEANPKKKE